jgi:predicted DNA-binding protein
MLTHKEHKTVAKRKNPTIGFVAPPELQQRIQDLAMREDRTVSQIVKRCVEEGISSVERAVGGEHAKHNA